MKIIVFPDVIAVIEMTINEPVIVRTYGFLNDTIAITVLSLSDKRKSFDLEDATRIQFRTEIIYSCLYSNWL